MLIREIVSEDISSAKALGYWVPQDDNSRTQLGDLRKTRLLLKDIRRLRKMVDARHAEKVRKSAFLRNIYKWVPRDQL